MPGPRAAIRPVKKLRSLGDMLLASVEQLAADPTRLSLFVDKGHVTIRPGSLSFEYGYTASLWVQDFAGDVDLLLIPLLAWVGQHQPDLFESGKSQPFHYEAELLDKDRCDIMVTIELAERVLISREAGGLNAVHLDDSPMTDAFEGVPDNTMLWQGIGDDLRAGVQLIVP